VQPLLLLLLHLVCLAAQKMTLAVVIAVWLSASVKWVSVEVVVCMFLKHAIEAVDLHQGC
jgi:hypothetical protein